MATLSPLTEETDPACLSPAEGALLLADAPWRRFAVVGDSLSAGTGDPTPGYATLGWSDRVADVLRRVHPGLAYLNVAAVGATTEATLAEQLDVMVGFSPDLLHVPCGANDLFARDPDFGRIEHRLGELFAAAAATGAQLTAFTLGRSFVVPGIPGWTQRVETINAITRRLANAHRAVLVDMYEHPVNDRPDLLSADGIHWAACGQAVMAAEVVKGLARVLA